MAAVTLTTPVSPEAYRGGDDFSQWGSPRVYVVSAQDAQTLDTGLPSIQRWAISKPSGAMTASLAAATGIFTFTISSGTQTCELLVWGPDTALVS